MKNKKIDYKKIIKDSIPIVVFIVAMCIATYECWPFIEILATDEGRADFKAWVDGLGFGGWLVTLGIQLAQIFVALIPGEPVELMLGYVWGPWLGTFTCLLGIFIGTAIIYMLVKKLGIKFVRRIVVEKDLNKYGFLKDKNKLDLTIFTLFFIPGTPKDVLTYIAPLTPIHPVKYLLIATFARIPSIITSTILGDSVAEGNYILAVIVFVITALISILGIIFGNKYMDKRQKKREEIEQNNHSFDIEN